jgi:uncharacterized membrane protein
MNIKKSTKWMLFGLGAGAAAGCLAYSEFGQEKLAAMAKGSRRLLRQAAHEGKKSLLDSKHKLAGLAAELSNHWKQQGTSDPVLEERIRSHMGRVVSHPRRIHVVCDHGVAVLWGVILEREISRLIQVVEGIAGVRDVVDYLDTASPDELPAEHAHPLKDARDKIRLNWSPSKRLLVGAAGAVLAVKGWQRKDRLGKGLAALGAGMMVRSTMQKHLRNTLALTESSPGFELEKTIRINAPISDIFDFWANPENYPKAFSHVANIERLGENLYRWTISGPGGVPVGWEGVITRVVPNTLVEWKSLPGSAIGNFGIAHFDPNYDASTRVNIRMFYRPPAGILGRFLAEMLGADANQILDKDLKRLKYLFENGAFAKQKKAAQEGEAELLKTATT